MERLFLTRTQDETFLFFSTSSTALLFFLGSLISLYSRVHTLLGVCDVDDDDNDDQVKKEAG